MLTFAAVIMFVVAGFEAPAASEPGYVGELERLAGLRDQGITDEDFEAKKKQLLGVRTPNATPARTPGVCRPRGVR